MQRDFFKVSSYPKNDPSRSGKLARPKVLFGEHLRYAIAPVHVREGERVMWFVWDTESEDSECSELPAVIRQSWSQLEALVGLEEEYNSRIRK